MKLLPKKLLPLTVFAIAVTSLFSVQPAQAFTITMDQVGSNVVATGSGAFNLTGLNAIGQSSTFSGIVPNQGFISIRPLAVQLDAYMGFTGPAGFGVGSFTGPNAASGDNVVMNGLSGALGVPHLYASGTVLSDSMTFNNRTFAGLGVTPGTYVWTWGTGLPNQNFTLQIGPAGVPDAGSTLSLLGFASLGLLALRRKLRC